MTFADLDAETQERLLDKLAKLKALSECPTGNVNETATAAATMTRIMLEYQIEMAELENASGEKEQSVCNERVYTEPSLNGYPAWQINILSALAEANHCQSYTSSTTDYDQFWTRRTRSYLYLIGTPRDIEDTRRLFFFLVDEVERLCKSWGKGRPVKRRNDFKRGAATAISDKVLQERDLVMQEENERASRADRASVALELFKRKEKQVTALARKLGIVTVTRRRRAVSLEAYHAGYEAGSRLDLNRGRQRQLTTSL